MVWVAQIIYVDKKMVANIIVSIIMSQNFQFVKVNIVNLKPKAVATFCY